MNLTRDIKVGHRRNTCPSTTTRRPAPFHHIPDASGYFWIAQALRHGELVRLIKPHHCRFRCPFPTSSPRYFPEQLVNPTTTGRDTLVVGAAIPSFSLSISPIYRQTIWPETWIPPPSTSAFWTLFKSPRQMAFPSGPPPTTPTRPGREPSPPTRSCTSAPSPSQKSKSSSTSPVPVGAALPPPDPATPLPI